MEDFGNSKKKKDNDLYFWKLFVCILWIPFSFSFSSPLFVVHIKQRKKTDLGISAFLFFDLLRVARSSNYCKDLIWIILACENCYSYPRTLTISLLDHLHLPPTTTVLISVNFCFANEWGVGLEAERMMKLLWNSEQVVIDGGSMKLTMKKEDYIEFFFVLKIHALCAVNLFYFNRMCKWIWV